MNNSALLRLILQLSTFSVLAGRAWQHLFWDAPYRSLLWDQAIMEKPVNWLLGMSWQAYAGSPAVDVFIQQLIVGSGWVYALGALAALLVNPKRKWAGYILIVCSIFLSFLSALYWKEKFWQVGQLLEYAAQVASPTLLYYTVYRSASMQKLRLAASVAVALTFICHGLYALGYYPIPGHFRDMLIIIFGLPEPTAIWVLQAAGVIDIILVGFGLFWAPTRPAATWYAIIWGFLTAAARTVAGFSTDFPLESLQQTLPETLYRLPHGLLPLYLLIAYGLARRVIRRRAELTVKNQPA
jgi:hypothetical protein